MPSAQRIRWAKFRTFTVIFVALLILGVFIVLLTGGTFFQPKDKLYVYVPDASGIGRNSPVRLNGIPIGKVERVSFTNLNDPNRVVLVEMTVAHPFTLQIPSDSVTAMTLENIAGEQYLDITKGRSPTPVRPGATLAFQPAPDVLKALDLAQFETRLRAIDELLAGIQSGEGKVGQFVMGGELYRNTARGIAELEKTMDEAVSTQRTLGNLLYRDDVYQSIAAPLRRLDEQLARIQRGEGGAGSMLRDAGPHDELRSRIAGIRGSLAELEKKPFFRQDAMYADWNRRITNLIVAVDQFNAGQGATARLFTRAESYESLNGGLRALADGVREFREDPRKFMRIKIF